MLFPRKFARLATAEYNFYIGDKRQARVFAMRAREMLTRGTPEWRRATDIVLVAERELRPYDDYRQAFGSFVDAARRQAARGSTR